jgi:hypothetical protein
METSGHRFGRLLDALDDLVSQEAITVRARDYEAVGHLQRRSAAVVEGLAALGPAVADARAKARVASLLARRQHTIENIESQLATTRDELHAIEQSERRMARIAPAYGTPAAKRSRRFHAAG